MVSSGFVEAEAAVLFPELGHQGIDAAAEHLAGAFQVRKKIRADFGLGIPEKAAV